MRYQTSPAEFFIENRRCLTDLLPPGALVILQANDMMPTNADGTLGFTQNSDLYYLSGIDVHDVPPSWYPIHAGMVFSVEPGICIREESLGIRLENDILIGDPGHTDLMADIPIEADEIEALMQQFR